MTEVEINEMLGKKKLFMRLIPFESTIGLFQKFFVTPLLR